MKNSAPLSHVAIILLLGVWQWENILAFEAGFCSCYLFNTKKETWIGSNQYCQEDGGKLVSMETEEEYQFINKSVQDQNVGNPDEWYIGLKKITVWKWISGESYTIIDKWLKDEPIKSGDCVKMMKDYGGLGLFDDVNCTATYMFICEYKTEQSCLSKTRIWCPLNKKLITTTTFSPTTKETPSTHASSTTNKRTDSYSSPPTDKKPTVIGSSSTKSGPRTKAFTHTTEPKAYASPISEKERATGPTEKIRNDPQSKSTGSSQFPLVIVVAVLGVVLAVSVCSLTFVCYWKRRNKGNKNKKPISETTTLPRDAIEQSSNKNQGPEDGGLGEGVQLFHQRGGDPYVAYAVIHNNLTQQNQGPAVPNEPAYASIEDKKVIKKFSKKNCPNAATPASSMNDENSGNSSGVGKSNTEAVYALVDKGKKNNKKNESQNGNQLPADQQVVYASVDKSKKSKARAEDVVYAEVGSKDNTEKQQPYQITYAELADFNQNASEEAVKPAPYQSAEYAVIGQKQKS